MERLLHLAVECDGKEFDVSGDVGVGGEDGQGAAFGDRADEEIGVRPLDAMGAACLEVFGGAFEVGCLELFVGVFSRAPIRFSRSPSELRKGATSAESRANTVSHARP